MIQTLNLNYEAVVLAFGFFVVLFLFSVRYRSRPRGGGALLSPRDSVIRSAYSVMLIRCKMYGGCCIGDVCSHFLGVVNEEVV